LLSYISVVRECEATRTTSNTWRWNGVGPGGGGMSYLVDMPGLSIFLQIRAAKLLVFSSVSCSSVNLNKKIKKHFMTRI
jgi:hypothetical protein